LIDRGPYICLVLKPERVGDGPPRIAATHPLHALRFLKSTEI
jgi:hypothetical protein